MSLPETKNPLEEMDGYTLKMQEESPDVGDLTDAEEVDFDFEGYQVVRGEFFSHLYEPSFCFNNDKVYVNSTCLKKLPGYEYVQILVNPDEKKLAVQPCMEDERDSFRWCSSSGKRSPKQITCRMFFAKVMTLMGWNPGYRYKLLGKLVKSNSELLFIFDLTSPEIYQRQVKEDGKVKNTRTPIFPEEWKNQFGQSYKDHQRRLQVGTFDGYTVFNLQPDPRRSPKKKEEVTDNEQQSTTGSTAQPADRPEEEQNPNT